MHKHIKNYVGRFAKEIGSPKIFADRIAGRAESPYYRQLVNYQQHSIFVILKKFIKFLPTTYHIPLKRLKPIHMLIIELHLLCWKSKDIATKLGVSTTNNSHTLRDPISKKIITMDLSNRLGKVY